MEPQVVVEMVRDLLKQNPSAKILMEYPCFGHGGNIQRAIRTVLIEDGRIVIVSEDAI